MLLLCSRSKLDKPVAERLHALLAQSVDWDYLRASAVRHGVAPLLYRSLQRFEERIPALQLDSLRKLYEHNERRNCWIHRTVAELAATFTAAGIPLLALKDAQLSMQVYPEAALRPMGDLDLLIHAGDLQRVSSIMSELGFTPQQQHASLASHVWACGYERDGLLVDMQWNICQREWDSYGEGNSNFEIEQLWRNAVFMEVQGQQVLVPKPEDMLFHLCLHLEGHRYCELILFVDIAEMLSVYEARLDWAYIIELARSTRSTASLYYVLLLTRHLLDAAIPDGVMQALKPLYFPAPIYDSLFGNLGVLHHSLDDIAQLASPPEPLMRRFETVVRRQAHGAMRLFGDVDALLTEFVESGGGPVLLDGVASLRIYPDALLEPFQPLQIVLLDDDLPRMRGMLEKTGFRIVEGAADVYARQSQFPSRDPLLRNEPTVLQVQVSISHDLHRVLTVRETPSRKEVAVDLIRRKLRSERGDEPRITASIEMVAMSPKELLVVAAAKLGSEPRERLFRLCPLLEVLRRSERCDWKGVHELALEHGVADKVVEALAIVEGFTAPGTVAPDALGGTGSAGRIRLLEFARFDPASWARYSGFKRAYYWMLVMLSLDSWRERLRYLWRSLRRRVLWKALKDFATALRKPQTRDEDVVFWLR